MLSSQAIPHQSLHGAAHPVPYSCSPYQSHFRRRSAFVLRLLLPAATPFPIKVIAKKRLTNGLPRMTSRLLQPPVTIKALHLPRPVCPNPWQFSLRPVHPNHWLCSPRLKLLLLCSPPRPLCPSHWQIHLRLDILPLTFSLKLVHPSH